MAPHKHRLCRTCATRFDNPQTENFRYEGTHHEDLAELERSADRGCYICTRLRIEIQKASGSMSTRPCLTSSKYQVRPTHDLREWKLDFELELSHRVIHAQFIVLDHLQYPREDFKCQISPNTLDPSCMSLARAWLRRCREQHTCQTECRSTIKGIYPTRLLHIRRSRSGSMKISLQYPHVLPVEVEYLTLSHMWGNQKFLKLTTQNHDDFLESVPLSALSQTFRDALNVTTELGFQYLWIDSLCILQDDEQDWKNESERMASIYKNAVCNLCASGSTSNGNGLLSKARALDPLPPIIHFDGDASDRTKLLSESQPWDWLRDSPLY
ncbi:heterokaryon incompatibility protein-domain-containing protein [Phaeosphaeria sp. MPI-PUGE-AT-0046c]|nr:heterokaryon incompatibility protein-domain-containing protein [Phaeosphaeria sp. MPI-PUGE-AT-0046c]